MAYDGSVAQRLILVTDDEPQLASTLAEVGKQLGIAVHPVPRAELARRARDTTPALVVLDVSHSDGLELLGTLKAGRATHQVPVVAVADADDPELRELALEVGADGFIPRPLPPDLGAKLLALLG